MHLSRTSGFEGPTSGKFTPLQPFGRETEGFRRGSVTNGNNGTMSIFSIPLMINSLLYQVRGLLDPSILHLYPKAIRASTSVCWRKAKSEVPRRCKAGPEFVGFLFQASCPYLLLVILDLLLFNIIYS